MPLRGQTLMAWQGSTRKATLPPGWDRIRKAILERDPVCRLRFPGCTVRSTEVDHSGHRNDHRPDMLRGVCHPCHLKRTLAQATAARTTTRRPPEPHPGLR